MDPLIYISRGELPTFGFGRVAYRAEPTAEEAAAAAAETASTPPGGTSGSPTDQSEFQAPFRLEDIEDESVRSHVDRYVKQVQGAYTRKTQALATERDGLKDALELQAALSSDDEATRDAAARKLLDQLGWDVDGEEEQPPPAAAAAAAAGTSPPPAAESDVNARLAALEGRETKREQDAEKERLAQFEASWESALDKHIKAVGLDPKKAEDADAIERERQAVAGYAATLNPVNGLPDIEGAFTLRNADRAALVPLASRPGYRESKDVPTPDTSGASGSPANPAGTQVADPERARYQRMLEVAGRHF